MVVISSTHFRSQCPHLLIAAFNHIQTCHTNPTIRPKIHIHTKKATLTLQLGHKLCKVMSQFFQHKHSYFSALLQYKQKKINKYLQVKFPKLPKYRGLTMSKK